MNVVDIFYVRYFTEDGSKLAIGGVETYITQLSRLIYGLGCKVRIFQYADYDFEKELDYATVYGYADKKRKNKKYLFNKANALYKKGNKYLTIIASDIIIPNFKINNSIAIQHGIFWDSNKNRGLKLFFDFLIRQIKAYPIVKRLQNVDEVVCVDNNFICWYRTQTSHRDVKLTPILNFAEIGPEESGKTSELIKIVFARRFFEIRGTRLFTPVAKRLLEKYSNIEITFAGSGPDENYIKDFLKESNRVNFTQYTSDESIKFLQQFNISVIPTVFSEGTSLSLLESLSAHCAVVCTNIGGMTNVVLDGYNGLMVSPNEDEIFTALCRLIESKELRNQLAKNGYETIKCSFSLEKWNEKWKDVLNRNLLRCKEN